MKVIGEVRRGARVRGLALAVAIVSMSMIAAACSSGTPAGSAEATTSTPSADGSSSTDGGPAAAIDAAYAELVKGTWTAPPTEASPGVPGKNIMLISCGEANDNCTDMGSGVKAAAKILGWNVKLCDGKLDPTAAQACFRQAVSQKVDGIVNLAWDCPIVKAPLQQAVDAGIKVIGVHAFDCGEINAGEKNLFNVPFNYGDLGKDQPSAWRAWGGAMGVAALKAAKGGAIIYPDDTAEFASFKFMKEGWDAKVKELSPETKVVPLPWTVSEVGPKLEAKVQAAILKNPDVTVVSAAVNPALGFLNGVKQSGKAGKIAVVEGHGSVTEGDWVRNGEMATLIGWPNDWWGYGALDALNSSFAGKPQGVIGIGFAIIDKEHNLYPSGQSFQGQGSGLDLAAAYSKRWGK